MTASLTWHRLIARLPGDVAVMAVDVAQPETGTSVRWSFEGMTLRLDGRFIDSILDAMQHEIRLEPWDFIDGTVQACVNWHRWLRTEANDGQRRLARGLGLHLVGPADGPL